MLNLHKAGTKDYAQSQATIAMADDAVRILSGKRSIYGAWQNRLEFIYANSCNMEENAQASESRIRDTDMADELTKFTKNNILYQSSNSMAAQSNAIVQNGLTPVFCDIDDSYNVDIGKLEHYITPNTCAIVVHNGIRS